LQDYLRSGGTERQSILLANAFAAAGHETTLLTFRPGGALAGTVAPDVHRHALQGFDTHLDWFAPGLRRFVRKSRPDLALCMGRMANCWAHAVHDVLIERCPQAAVVCTMRTGKPLPYLFRRSLRVARHVVANSRDARDTLIARYRVTAEKISVIHNSLVFPAEKPVTETQAVREALRREHGATAQTRVLLCVAMFRPEKNQRELIEIVAGLPASLDWQLWLAGEGAARAECERLVAEKNLGRRVKFLGFQRNPASLYAAADLAVHASWSEALSNFLIEAQAHGLPAIAYEAQGIAECFVPGRTGWTIPRDDRAGFREALVRGLGDAPAERAARTAQARAYAREAFDPRRQVAAYLDLFARLAPQADASRLPA
jgi:glycosyltransferase involved in cell wall biosynthesis